MAEKPAELLPVSSDPDFEGIDDLEVDEWPESHTNPLVVDTSSFVKNIITSGFRRLDRRVKPKSPARRHNSVHERLYYSMRKVKKSAEECVVARDAQEAENYPYQPNFEIRRKRKVSPL